LANSPIQLLFLIASDLSFFPFRNPIAESVFAVHHWFALSLNAIGQFYNPNLGIPELRAALARYTLGHHPAFEGGEERDSAPLT
jgi:hypothetical protein